MNGIALVLRSLGRGTAIEPMLREALAINCQVRGNDCSERQHTIELLATELANESRGGEMVALLQESVDTYTRTGGRASPDATRTIELLERCRRQLTDGDAGEGSPARANGGGPTGVGGPMKE
jgi:hypothetical protein